MPTITLANGRQFPCEPGVSILDAALASGVMLEHSCRNGRCGSCKARAVCGLSRASHDEPSLSPQEIASGWMLTCMRVAANDLTLDIEDLSALAGMSPKTVPCRIDQLELVAPDVMKVVLRLPPTAGFLFRPGQYVDVMGPGGVRRSYSIASPDVHPGRIELHVKRFEGGAMSTYWFVQARPNDLLRFRGPLGTFFLRDVADRDLVFLATGTGYAPIQSMLAQLGAADMAPPRSVSLYWGGRARADFYADPTLARPGLRFVPVLSRPDGQWNGARGHVQDVLIESHPGLQNTVVYACGSEAMVRDARTLLTAAGLPVRSYFADAFVSSTPLAIDQGQR